MQKLLKILASATLLPLLGGMQCREAADIIEQYHFTTLHPPSTLYYVGAVVAVNVGEDGKIEAGSLKLSCGPRANMGKSWTPISSHTVSESVKTSSRSKWNLGADVLSVVKSKASLQNVESIEVTLKNARIVTMSDTDILENIAERSEDCRRAIMARLEAGFSLTIISQALVADLDYSVKFKETSSVDKRVRARQMNDIAVTLGGGHTRLSERTIESRGLTIGIKTDSFLMALSLADNLGNKLESVDSDDDGERSIQMKRANTSEKSDSELVLPGGGYVQPIADGF